MLLNILYAGRAPMTKIYLAPDVRSAELEKLPSVTVALFLASVFKFPVYGNHLRFFKV